MMKGIIKIEDARLVTVGTLKKALKEERGLTLQELLRLEGKVDKGFSEMEGKFVTNERFDKHMTAIGESFNQVHETLYNIQKAVVFILEEIAAIRAENREFRESLAYLDRSYLSNEQKIEYLDTRVLKLETAK